MLNNEDTLAIHNLLNLYHYYVDEPGFPRVREIFTEDCIFDSSDFGGPVTHGIAELEKRFSRDSGVLVHTCSNIILTEDPDGTIRSVSKCVAMIPDGKVGAAIHADVLRRTADGWRIAKRVISKPPRLKG